MNQLILPTLLMIAILNTIHVFFTIVSNIVYKINNKKEYLAKEFTRMYITLAIAWGTFVMAVYAPHT